MARRKNRRKRPVIDLNFQFKVVFVAVLSSCLALLINSQLSLGALWGTSETLAGLAAADIVAELKSRLVRELAISAALGVPLAAAIGILYSFKCCGPLYRIKKHLEAQITGSWRVPCVLRKGDDLQDVARVINQSAGLVCEYADDAHDLLQEVRAVLLELDPPEDDATAERIIQIRERIAREEDAYAQHFGLPIEQTGESCVESTASQCSV